jgi:O-antigen ligase
MNGFYRVEQAHNDYLQTLADAGILGFACITAFIFLFFKRSLNVISSSADGFRKGTAVGALAGCFGILVHSFFDFPLRTPSNAFFFLLLVVLATVSINNSKRHVS